MLFLKYLSQSIRITVCRIIVHAWAMNSLLATQAVPLRLTRTAINKGDELNFTKLLSGLWKWKGYVGRNLCVHVQRLQPSFAMYYQQQATSWPITYKGIPGSGPPFERGLRDGKTGCCQVKSRQEVAGTQSNSPPSKQVNEQPGEPVIL
jgi:hypothetical protein